jgi:peptide deformylase
MILPIYVDPNPILRTQASPITETTPELRQLVTDMRETMHKAIGIGLAAPQVGCNVALIVIELLNEEEPENDFPFTALLNPRITWHSKKQWDFSEACLSIPGVEGMVRRPEAVRVKAHGLEGSTIEIEANGLLARVLQHEIDHLHGKLFTDYVAKKKLISRPLVDYPQILPNGQTALHPV